MSSMSQLQLCIDYHQSFDAFPYTLVILVYCLEINHKTALLATGSHTKTTDCI